ncbi:MAG: biotin--[acetyl-CoA-carboxylase] ligase [Clostridiales bacterium]|nr:biotin--[acetyl-CoA-carboxylase] ligase [Clostridiales bacterium]
MTAVAERLNETLIHQALRLPETGVQILDTVDSTNLRLKEAARAGRVSPPFLLAAERQTAGRGRLGRRFVSPAGGLYMSLLLPWRPGENPGALTLLSAVAVCRAIEEETGLHPRIKWVNDIFVGSRKVCGILAEAGEGWAVAGIGVNLLSPPGGFPPEAGAAGALDVPADKNRLAARIAALILNGSAQPDPEGVLAAYRERMFLTGKTVRYTEKGAEKTALVLGVSDDGGLLVREDGGEKVLRSGEVTVGSQSVSRME